MLVPPETRVDPYFAESRRFFRRITAASLTPRLEQSTSSMLFAQAEFAGGHASGMGGLDQNAGVGERRGSGNFELGVSAGVAHGLAVEGWILAEVDAGG